MHARIQKVLSEGVQLRQHYLDFFVDEGRTDDLYSIVFSNKSGPVLIIKQYFCDFLGGCPDPLPPSGSAHVLNSLDSVDAGVAIVFVFLFWLLFFLKFSCSKFCFQGRHLY